MPAGSTNGESSKIGWQMRSPEMFLLSPELTVTLLCSPVANKSLLTSDLASSMSASLIYLQANPNIKEYLSM